MSGEKESFSRIYNIKIIDSTKYRSKWTIIDRKLKTAKYGARDTTRSCISTFQTFPYENLSKLREDCSGRICDPNRRQQTTKKGHWTEECIMGDPLGNPGNDVRTLWTTIHKHFWKFVVGEEQTGTERSGSGNWRRSTLNLGLLYHRRWRRKEIIDKTKL